MCLTSQCGKLYWTDANGFSADQLYGKTENTPLNYGLLHVKKLQFELKYKKREVT